MNNNHVFRDAKIYRWRAPQYKIKAFLRGCKMVIQRARYGYATNDLWNFDSYLINMFAKAFQEFALNHYGHPYELTDEEWTKILQEIASCFRDANEDTSQWQNEYEDEYFSHYSKFVCNQDSAESQAEYERMRTLYLKREEEISILRKEQLKRGLELFVKYFSCFWD